MIPIGDELRSRRTPFVTWGLIGLNGLIFVVQLLLSPLQLDRMFMSLGVVPAYLTDPWNHPFAAITLFTSIFLHGGWAHITGNMLYLWIFGDNVEDTLGHIGYLLFYLAAGVAANIAQVAIAPSSTVPGIGASGAIAGVLGVYMVLYPRAPVRVLVPVFYFMRLVRIPSLIVLGFWFVLQLFSGVFSLGSMDVASGGVAYFAHIGGFVVGLAMGAVLRAVNVRREVW